MASSNQRLKKLLWKYFSIYIRKRDADKDGFVNCVSCGKRMHWKESSAGHYYPKTTLSMYFEEKNVHNQCNGCNLFRRGNLQPYALYLIKRYGEEILKELEWKRRQLIQIHDNEYEKFILLYKNKIKSLDGKETKM